MTTGRRRLSPRQRREQLLEIGAELFAQRPYEEVWIEEVAERAGVSRGLLYHYFPNKRDFFAAVITTASASLPRLADIDPSLPLTERLVGGLDSFLRYVETHEHSYRAIHQAPVGSDPNIRAMLRENNEELERRIVASLAGGDHDAGDQELQMLRLAVRGWLAFVIAACLDWLDTKQITRQQLRDLCVRTLLGAAGVPLTGPAPGTTRELCGRG